MADTFSSVERDGWDSRAGVYGDSTALMTTQAIPDLMRAVRPRVGVRLLDIGTGPGYAAGAAEAIGCDVTGLLRPAMVAEAHAVVLRQQPAQFAPGALLLVDGPDPAFARSSARPRSTSMRCLRRRAFAAARPPPSPCRASRFPHLVLYRELPDRIEV